MTRATCILLLFATIPCASIHAEPPAKRLDLTRWKLTLPIDTAHPGRPDEITWPLLGTFTSDDSFFVNPAGPGVVFRAACGGIPTKGSKYPRCELREMRDAKTEAAWATNEETPHTLVLRAAVTQLPPIKKHVVIAQIHDADDDLLMIRLEDEKLFIERNKLPDIRLDSNYTLGTPFDLKIQAAAGRVQLWHNGDQKLDWPISRSGCYFKAGCYTQSNPQSGDTADSHAEVIIFNLKLDSAEGGG